MQKPTLKIILTRYNNRRSLPSKELFWKNINEKTIENQRYYEAEETGTYYTCH